MANRADLVFILPSGGGGGGAHSVMQEAETMCRMGYSVRIASSAANAVRLKETYKDLRTVSRSIVSYEGVADLAKSLERLSPARVVATTNQSVRLLRSVMAAMSDRINAAYYIQDYEPLFYEYKSSDWLEAYASYTAIDDALCFAKTKWLKETVERNHDVAVSLVCPSLDHSVYYPNLKDRFGRKQTLTVAAMIRPATPRRAPRRTTRLLNRIAEEFSDDVQCLSFGCSLEDLDAHDLHLASVTHLGVLSRRQVGDLFRTADVFLDLSDYQAFGRSAIEAMATGAISVVPVHGGSSDFALNFVNSLVVDTRDDEQIVEAVRNVLGLNEQEQRRMSEAAVSTGQMFTLERAALSEISLLL